MHDAHDDLDHALEQAIARLSADSGTIHVRDGEELVLHLAAHHNVPERLLPVIREIPWGKGMAGLAAQSGEPIDYCNLQTSTSPEIHSGARDTLVQGAIVVPMMSGNEVVGAIGVGCKEERNFSESEVRWLLDLGRRLGSDLGDHRMAA